MSFRLKTILGIALIELAVMLVLIFMNQLNFGGTASSQLYDRARVTSKLFSAMVADAVISTDLATIDSMIANTLGDDDIIYLRVMNDSGAVFSEDGDDDALKQIFVEDRDFEAALNDSRLDVSAPIEISGQVFGRIELGLSTRHVERGIELSLLWNLTIASMGMLLVALFGFILGSILTRQLSLLRDGAEKIAEGNLDHRVPIRGRDELAETTRCFNSMAQSLATQRNALEIQQNDLLEKRDRVREIVDVMRQIEGGTTLLAVPSQDRDDEIGEMARATAVFRNTIEANIAARREQARLIEAFDRLSEQVAIFDDYERVIFANAAFRHDNAAIIEALPPSYSYCDFLLKGLEAGQFVMPPGNQIEWIGDFRTESSVDGGAAELVRANSCRVLMRETRVESVGMVVIGTDITELRNTQAQAVHASKLATLGEMAAGLAHELNQPLGVIRMGAGNMLRRIEKHGLEMEYARKKLERIADQTERAAKIIDHMRIFARKDDARIEAFDLTEAVRDATTMMQAQLSDSRIQIDRSIPSFSVKAFGSKVMFEQVLVNLLANARDAILGRAEREGDGVAKRVSVALVAGDEGTVLTVHDTGGGIPEGTRTRLFEPFYTTKAPGKGTGLGLSISYGIIRDMGGEIAANNKGEGCEFVIRVPRLHGDDTKGEMSEVG